MYFQNIEFGTCGEKIPSTAHVVPPSILHQNWQYVPTKTEQQKKSPLMEREPACLRQWEESSFFFFLLRNHTPVNETTKFAGRRTRGQTGETTVTVTPVPM